MSRRYADSRDRRTLLGTDLGPIEACEHYDGERSRLVCEDSRRGHICPPCDSSLDEMFSEGTFRRRATATESSTGKCTTCSDMIARDGTCRHVRKLLGMKES